jgi:hypothetical protein
MNTDQKLISMFVDRHSRGVYPAHFQQLALRHPETGTTNE